MQTVTISIEDADLKRLQALASSRDVSDGQILREALLHYLNKHLSSPKTSRRADEALVAPIRAILALPIAQSTSWYDLERRLKTHDFRFEPLGGGLVLRRISDGRRICKASELGPSYARLCSLMGGPMPGHRMKVQRTI